MAFDSSMFGSSLGGFLGGIFGNSDQPYDNAMNQYREYGDKAQSQLQPYAKAGADAIPHYQQWLESQKDPSKFINDTMGNYHESPYERFLQQQSMFAGQNAASANGLSGSTPMMMQMQQNAGNIASQDQNQWLQNVLGINTQYGQGQQNMMNSGSNAANSLASLYSNMGNNMGEQQYNKSAAKQNNFWNTIGSGAGMIGSFL